MLRLCEIIFLMELGMFLIYIIVNPTNIIVMIPLKFPKPEEDFRITCTVGKYKYNVLPVLFIIGLKLSHIY